MDTDWLNELAQEMRGYYHDEEGDTLLVVTDPEGFSTTWPLKEILQLKNSNMSPREAADVLRQGGV